MMTVNNIPEGWRCEKLKDCISLIESGSRPKGGVKGILEGIPSFGGEHLDNYGGFKFYKMKFVPISFFDSVKKGIIEQEDILIVKDGATTGKVSFVGNNFPYEKACINEHLFKLRVIEKLNSKLLFYFLYSPFGQEQLKKNITGSAQGGINLSIRENIEIIYPESKPLQQKIVSEIEKQFSRLDESEKELKSVKDKLSLYKKSVLKDAFEMREGWEEKELRDVCENFKNDIVDGPFGSNLKRADFVKSGIPVLKIQNIKENKIILKKMDYVSREKYEELKRHSYTKNDIIMTKLGNPLGISAIVQKNINDGLIVADLVRIRTSKIDNKFLCYLLNSPRISDFINSKQKGTTRPRVKISIVRELPIPFPSLPLQQKIVQEIEQKFSIISNVEKEVDNSLNKIEKLRKSVLKSAFEGELVRE